MSTSVISFTVVVLVGVIAVEIVSPLPTPTVQNVVDRRKPPDAVAEARLPNVDMSAAIASLLARPLFSATRRPPADQLAGTSTSDRAEPPRLTGILVSGENRRAIFAPRQSGTRSLVKDEGDPLDGYTVRQISREGVTLIDLDGAERLVTLGADMVGREAGAAAAFAARLAFTTRAAVQVRVLDVLRTIPSEKGRLGPPGGPVPLLPGH